MPISRGMNAAGLQIAVSEMYRMYPIGSVRSALDVGAGLGVIGVQLKLAFEWGFTQRSDDWEFRLEGIEGWGQYESPLWEVYDRMYVALAQAILPSLKSKSVDVVTCFDMIEHLDDPYSLLGEFERVAKKLVVIGTPVGHCPQDAVGGNELERHRSEPTGQEMAKRGYLVEFLNDGLSRFGGVGGIVAYKVMQ